MLPADPPSVLADQADPITPHLTAVDSLDVDYAAVDDMTKLAVDSLVVDLATAAGKKPNRLRQHNFCTFSF